MAKDRKVNIVVGAKDEASKTLRNIGGSVVVMNQAMELATKIGRGFQEAYDFAKMGAEVEKAEFAFNKMSEAVGADAGATLDKIRELTGGTISDFELMRKAAKATTLGIPIDKVGEFAEVARAAAAAMGESTDFMFDSIVTGTARQSKLILDNLGIMIDMGKVYADETKRLGHALSETEKKQAFMNAVIVAGQKIVQDIGDTSELTSEKFAKFEASIDNLQAVMAKLLAGPLGTMLSLMTSLIDKVTKFFEKISDLTKGTTAFTKAVQDGTIPLETWNETFEESVRLMDLALTGQNADVKVRQEVIKSLLTEEEAQANVNAGLADFRASLGQTPADASVAVDGINNVRIAQEELTRATEGTIEAEAKWVEDSTAAMNIIRKNALALMEFKTELLEKEVKEFEDAQAAKVQSVVDFTDVAMETTNRMLHQLIDDWTESKLQMKDLFIAMAKDYLHFFLDVVTDMLRVATRKWLESLILFDVRANDLMVIQMGRDYARYFQQGVSEGIDMNRFASGMMSAGLPSVGGGAVQIGAAVPASGITIHIHGNVIGQERWLKDELLPAIENAQLTGDTILAVE